MTPEEIQELRRLEREATPGEWQAMNGYGPLNNLMHCYYIGTSKFGPVLSAESDLAGRREDIELCCHARNFLPRLLDEIERLKAENARLKASVAHAEQEIHILRSREIDA